MTKDDIKVGTWFKATPDPACNYGHTGRYDYNICKIIKVDQPGNVFNHQYWRFDKHQNLLLSTFSTDQITSLLFNRGWWTWYGPKIITKLTEEETIEFVLKYD